MTEGPYGVAAVACNGGAQGLRGSGAWARGSEFDNTNAEQLFMISGIVGRELRGGSNPISGRC